MNVPALFTRRLPLAVAVILTAGVSLARTVVLWPMSADTATGSSDLPNAAGAGDGLTLVNAVAAPLETDWNLPKNLENIGSVGAREIVGNAYRRQAYSDTAGRWLIQTNDFTVEAFVKIDAIPAVNGQGFFFHAFTNATGTSGSTWSAVLRHSRNMDAGKTQADVTFELNVSNGDRLMSTVTDLDTLTNCWHHLAVTHAYDASKNKGSFRLYWDGQLQGDGYTGTLSDTMKNPPTTLLDLMTRFDGWYGQKMRMSFFRISDCVLTTDQFMSATGARTIAAPYGKTVAYWKLGKGTDGNVDGADSVGQARLSGGLTQLPGAVPADAKPTMVAAPDCAFSGNPPNPTVTLSEGNAGSWQAVDAASTVYCHGVGPQLPLTSAFTVEGYLKPLRVSADASTVGHVFMNAGDTAGWSLDFGKSTDGWKFRIAATDAGGILASGAVSADLSNWVDGFKHVAVVYDPAGGASGFGLWTCYIDGALAGSVENVRAAASATFGENAFTLGGGTDGFLGYYDCVRVSTAALAPAAFLCAASGTAASNVLALWPLNRLAGEQPDGRDVADGTYSIHELNSQLVLSNKAGVHIVVTANDDAPTVTNPDPSPAFAGDSSAVTGSAQFYQVAKDRRYLMTADRDVLAAVTQSDGYTFEGYFKVQTTTLVIQALMSLCHSFAVSNVSACAQRMRFDYRRGVGFSVYSPGTYIGVKNVDGCTSDDYIFPDTASLLEDDVWYHVALTVGPDATAGYMVYTLYVNGTACGSKRGKTGSCFTSSDLVAVSFGGFPTGDKAYVGAMSSLRISRGVLSASEFLCAAAATPSASTARPIACWPLDNGTDGVNVDSFLGGAALLASAAGCAGDSTCARRRIVSPWLDDTAWPKTTNVGSVRLSASGNLSSILLGTAFELTGAFTVEGWLKESGNDGSVSRIVGAACAETDSGWELRLDKTGATPRLRLYACDGNAMPVIDDAFSCDASALSADWTHVGLAYEPPAAANGGLGVWTLFLDGQQAGTLTNRRNPGRMTVGHVGYSAFTLGGDDNGCKGLYDIWRVTEGALDASQLMFTKRSGCIFVIY